MPNYTFTQVNKGDEVQFKNKYIDYTNYNWTVIAKLDKSILMVELNAPGLQERRMIDIADVTMLVPKKNNR